MAQNQDDMLQGSLLMSLLPTYPIINEEYDLCDRPHDPMVREPIVDRVQISMSADRHMLLIRHYKHLHWCGYVPIERHDWTRIRKSVEAVTNVNITYMGAGSQYIAWMVRNQSGKLKTPVSILRGGNNVVDDFWIGFSTANTRADGELLHIEQAKEILYGFENLMWRLKKGDIPLVKDTSI